MVRILSVSSAPASWASPCAAISLRTAGIASSVEYAAKDNGYALELGRESGVQLRGAQTVAAVLEEARAAGCGGACYPVIAKIVDRG